MISPSRGYQVAKYGNTTHKQHIRARRETHGQLWTRDAPTLAKLCRDSYIHEPVVMRMVDYRANRVVGRFGPRAQLNTGSKQLDSQIEAAWNPFTQTMGNTGMTWGEFTRVLSNEKLIAGESFVVSSIDSKSKNIQFQIFETEQLDDSVEYQKSEAGGYYARGILYDTLNKPVQYSFRSVYPGTRGYSSAFGENSQKFPAKNVCHYYDRERPTQFRGISKLATLIQSLFLINDIDIAELEVKRLESRWGVYLKGEGDAEALIDGLEDTDANGNNTNTSDYEFDVASGAVNSGNFDVQTIDPRRPGSSYIEFTRNITKRCAAAFAVPYSAASGDTSQSNYSSERAASMHCKPVWDADRKSFAKCVATFVFEKWLQVESLKPTSKIRLGNRTAGDIAQMVTWQFDGYEWVDPKAEGQALMDKLTMGVLTYSDACMAVGSDPDIQRKQIAKDIDEFESLGFMPDYYKLMQGSSAAVEAPSLEEVEDDGNDSAQG